MSENQSDLKAFFNPIPDYTGKIVLRNVVHKTSLICCVLDCRERVNETTTLHSFPRNHALRRLWKTTAKINKPIRLWHRICNQHFTPADYVGNKNSKKRRLKPGAVPSLNLPNLGKVAAPIMSVQKRALEMVARTKKHKKVRLTEAEKSSETEESSETKEMADAEFDNGNEEDPICIHLEIEGTEIDENDSVPTQRDVAVQVDMMHARVSKFSKFINTDKALNAWTGIPTYQKLKTISGCVENIYNRLHYSLPQLGTNHQLSIEQKVSLCFIKLKTNISFECISSLFDISPASCSRAFASVIPLIREALQCVVYFPSVEEIRSNLPNCLKKDAVRGVLDCIEINIEIRKCTNCRNSSYSGYKQSDTTKFLYCITPGGLISYVSNGYSGNSTDKFIFNNENLISRFDYGDAIIVDRGFPIEEEAKSKGIKLIRPKAFQPNQQFNESDVITNTKVAVVKINVERVIEKMKLFKIVSGTVEYDMLPYIDDIVFIIASIVNMSIPNLNKIKF